MTTDEIGSTLTRLDETLQRVGPMLYPDPPLDGRVVAVLDNYYLALSQISATLKLLAERRPKEARA
jgi:hypothetical protein